MQIVLSVNQRNIEIEINNLNQQISTIKKLSECFEKIVGKKEISTLEAVNEAIKLKSGFVHVESSATLLGLLSELQYIEQNLNTIDLSNFNISNDYSTIEVKKEVLEAIREAHTTYLSAENTKIYNQLQKAIDVLNLVDMKYYKAIKQNYLGKFEINKMVLHNADKF